MKIHLTLNGNVRIAGSKSILNRVLMLAPFFKSPFRLENCCGSRDVDTIINNLQKLGLEIDLVNCSAMTLPPQQFNDNASYFVQDSATALRFLITRLALIPGLRSTVDASQQLQDRPHDQLINLLKELGVQIQGDDFPFKLTGREFTGGKVSIPVNISSQFVSAFLLCSHDLRTDLEITFAGDPVSVSYIDLTIKVLEQFGVQALRKKQRVCVAAGQKLVQPASYYVEPDISSACYFLALGALNEGTIKIAIPDSSIQPDFAFLAILQKMGAKIEFAGDFVRIKRKQLRGIKCDMTALPDQVPTLACLALMADAPTTITGIEHLRYKESNRLQALLQELPKLGAHIAYSSQRIYIEPLKKVPPACVLHTYNDHRLVMAFTIINLLFPQVQLDGVEAVKKSFPGFFQTLASLR